MTGPLGRFNPFKTKGSFTLGQIPLAQKGH